MSRAPSSGIFASGDPSLSEHVDDLLGGFGHQLVYHTPHMLTYLFWHWPSDGVDMGAYEQALCEFHRRLRRGGCPGLLSTAALAVTGVPWAANGQAAYEDWHLLADSAALDALNAAAVSGDQAAAHAEVARQAGGGTAGLYHLALGVATLDDALCQWFSKPPGMRYDELLATMSGHLASGGCLWQRRMVLGPGPEFCLVAPEAQAALRGLAYLAVRRRRLC